MSDVKRWYQNAVVVGSLAILLPGAAGFGVAAHSAGSRLDACLNHIQEHQDADREKQDAVGPNSPGAADQHHGPAYAGRQVGTTDQNGAEIHGTCKGLAMDAADAISRASYELSLLGYYATLFFGAIGVIGIFLGFSTARDARDDARAQAAAAGSAEIVGAADRRRRKDAPLMLLGLACMAVRRVGGRVLGRR